MCRSEPPSSCSTQVQNILGISRLDSLSLLRGTEMVGLFCIQRAGVDFPERASEPSVPIFTPPRQPTPPAIGYPVGSESDLVTPAAPGGAVAPETTPGMRYGMKQIWVLYLKNAYMHWLQKTQHLLQDPFAKTISGGSYNLNIRGTICIWNQILGRM
jgi:hypothetical protein